MKKSRSFFLFVGLHLLCFVTIAQTNHFKFDFGTGKIVPGYLSVTPSTIFNTEKGYGFSHGSYVIAVDRGGKALTGDFITSSKPFYFKLSEDKLIILKFKDYS
jgi:hypothetical protein